jgi:hypothetical protein
MKYFNPLSLENQKYMRENFLIIEGYGSTSRIYLPDLRAEGRVVPIDGVGGCTLLIRADCHRKGLDFPEKLFDHHIIISEGRSPISLSIQRT